MDWKRFSTTLVLLNGMSFEELKELAAFFQFFGCQDIENPKVVLIDIGISQSGPILLNDSPRIVFQFDSHQCTNVGSHNKWIFLIQFVASYRIL